jgi:DNA polymerase-3 subunit alpha
MCFDMHQTDKLAIFCDDMRRLEIQCLPPSVNASEAEFSVEAKEDANRGVAVRYALGALKGVGEKAMEQLVEERNGKGAFKSLDDFADRIDPRLLNRRQLESLAAGGAFDPVEPNRAAVFAAAETILAHAASAADARNSGQGGLFGGESNVVPIRMPSAQSWTLAQRMAAEKDAFGFYFSAHPVDNFRHIADAQGARTFAQLASLPASAEGSRTPGVMAGLIEDTRWRTSARGRRYLMATVSDSSGQFDATCFEDETAAKIEQAAKDGACALLHVELDRRPGEEAPRVSIKALQSFEGLSRRARLQLEVEVDGEAAIARLASALTDERGGNGELRLRARLANGTANLILGRDFNLDAELAARVEQIEGVTAVRLSVATPPRLALVS